MATTVGVRELKNALSRYLRLVHTGESVVVLDRGRPVAILSAVPESGGKASLAEHLASLGARGLLALGRKSKRRPRRATPRVDLSGAVSDDRGEPA